MILMLMIITMVKIIIVVLEALFSVHVVFFIYKIVAAIIFNFQF